MSSFVPLHVHSHYSLLSALPKIPELVGRAKLLGLDALALTDSGNLYGALEFYKECKKAGLKPILGMHAYLALRSRKDKQTGVDNRRHRLILLAKDALGYRNLLKLSSLGHLEGFYYKPRIDRELLAEFGKGLIAIVPAFDSDIRALLQAKDEEKLEERLLWYKEVFGKDNVYLEISRHKEIPGHEEMMRELMALSKRKGVPLVASQEVYYLLPEEKKARETLLLVNSQGDHGELRTDDSDFSFRDPKEVGKLFADIPEALENTARIAAQCTLDLPLGKWVFPAYKTTDGKSHDEELRVMLYAGLTRRAMEKTKELEERIEYELKIIRDKGYAPYFLVVAGLM